MSSKKVVIIGANSFLGRNLIEELRQSSFDLTLFARNQADSFKDYAFEIFNYPQNPLDFNKVIKADVIIYAVGAGVQASLKESSELIFQLNAFLPISLLNFLQENKFQGKIVTFGSYFELGNKAEAKAYSEDELVSINTLVPNHYCGSKRLLTRFIGNGLLTINYYHLILPTIYGPGENQSRLIPYVVNQLINKLPLTLTSGEQSRAYLYVKDLCRLLEEFITEDFAPGIYNVAAAEQLQVKSLVQLISLNLNLPLNFTANAAIRNDVAMKHLELNAVKLSKATTWKPKKRITDIIHLYKKDKIA